jgi:hypothetical protein
LDIYQTIEDPTNAIFLVLGLVMGAGALQDVGKVTQAARAQRNLMKAKPEDIAKLGKTISDGLGKVQRVSRMCRL